GDGSVARPALGGVSDRDRDVAAAALRGLRAGAPPELLEGGWHRREHRDRRVPRVPLAPPPTRARARRAAILSVRATAKKLARVLPEAVERFSPISVHSSRRGSRTGRCSQSRRPRSCSCRLDDLELAREGGPIGAIVLGRTDVRPFDDVEIRLSETF